MSDTTLVFIGMVFATVFLLIQGLAIPVFGEGAKVRKRLNERLKEIESNSDVEGFASILREKYLRKLRPWERALERLPAMEKLAKQIEQSGNQYLAYRVTFVAIVLAICVGLFAWANSRILIVSLLGAAMAGYLPFMKISFDRRKRMERIEEQLPDAIDTMARALRAGHPFNAALKMVADDLDDPVAGEFALTFGDLNYGNDLRRAMLGLLSRVPSVTMMALITAVLVQKETGGNLAEILQQISGVIRGRFRFFRKVRTLSAEGRMSAWVLAMVPLVLFASISLTTPDYLPMLLEDARGQKMIIYGMVSGAVGIFWIRKLLRIEV